MQRINTGSSRRRWPGSWRGAAAALALIASAAAVTGCVATVGAEGAVVYGYPTVYAEVEPIDLAVYPRVYYRGSYAYLVDGVWYYPTARGWVVFRQEPVELYRYRTRYLPPRYGEPYRGYGYPTERPRTYERERPRTYERPLTPPRERPRTYQPR